MYKDARDVKTGQRLPLLTRLGSAQRSAYRSENSDIKSAMLTMNRHLSCAPLWVIDRGGDRMKLWDSWLTEGYRMLVRVANQRYWVWRGELKNDGYVSLVDLAKKPYSSVCQNRRTEFLYNHGARKYSK